MPEFKPENVKMEASWKALLSSEFEAPYFAKLSNELHTMKLAGETSYPPGPQIFRSFELTPVSKLKVVILGQDPYHNPGEAMGLSFSVPRGIRIPPSLLNIYKELRNDLNLEIPTHGDLTYWAEQGVLLLNAILTVSKNKPASHRNLGWQNFTDAVISSISENLEGIVFLLWGNFAKNKASLINQDKHLVLSSAHPSPLAGNAFFNNHHFSQANAYLTTMGKAAIDWQIPVL